MNTYLKAKNYTINNDSIEGKAVRNKSNNEAQKEGFKGRIALSDIKSIQEDQNQLCNHFFIDLMYRWNYYWSATLDRLVCLAGRIPD